MRIFAAIVLCVGFLIAPSFAEKPGTHRISHFSGKPVPRFETLRYAAVNGRAGPSRDHPIRWRYEREGMPVLIIKESQDWRRVRDADGDEVWMHKRTLSERPQAMVRDGADLYQRPESAAPIIAKSGSGALVRVTKCEGLWCKVSAEGHSGWVEAARLWGINPDETSL